MDHCSFTHTCGTSPSPLSQIQCHPSPIGLPQCAAILSWKQHGKLSLNATTPNGCKCRLNRSTRQVNDGGNNAAQPANHAKCHIVIPYTHMICGYGIHFKGGKTIKNLLVSPRTRTLCQWCHIQVATCDEYMSNFVTKSMKAPSAIHHHITGNHNFRQGHNFVHHFC